MDPEVRRRLRHCPHHRHLRHQAAQRAVVQPVSKTPSAHLPALPADLRVFEQWNPDAQQEALDLLKSRQRRWLPFFCKVPGCDGHPHAGDPGWSHNHARADQHVPKWSGDWLVLCFSGGRGAGKSRTGSEITHRITERVPWCKGRMPRYRGRPEPDRRLSDEDRAEFGGLMITYREGVPGGRARERRRSR